MTTLLEVDRLSKSFGVKVIDDLSVSVARGEALGIIGPNGAGKTTMLNLIAGDLTPDEGRVVFDGVDITAQSSARPCRTGIGRTSLDDANTPAGALPLLKRKRLELARALSTEPTVLLLDEIAGGLTEAEVLELVETIKGIHADGVTIVWIEHIVHALLAVVDRIFAMSFGTKIAEGEPEAVMNSPEVQEVYMGVAPE